MKTIHIDLLNIDSVKQGIAELKEVRHEWVIKKNRAEKVVAQRFAEILDEQLMNVDLRDTLFNVKTGEQVFYKPDGTSTRGLGWAGPVWAKGNTVYLYSDEIMFVEFGAGVHYNAGFYNPLSEEFKVDTKIGSYGKGHGNQDYWFVFHDTISRGTPMQSPIYKSLQLIKPEIPTLVRQVFV